MKLVRLQTKFRNFLLEGAAAPLERHVRDLDRHADERLMIHYNNCRITLEAALADNFPVLCRLVGPVFFRQLAQGYIGRYPPETPVLAEYGMKLPDYIAGIDELSEYGYLQDIARLENAWNRALHSRDAVPVAPEELSTIDMSVPEALRFDFLPSLSLISSRYPLCRIWDANKGQNAVVEEINLDDGPDYILLYRPQWTVEVLSVPPAIFEFVRLLATEHSLGQAVDKISENEAGFQLSEALGLIFSSQLITGITSEKDL